ncbi:MAG: hypothetical protein ACI9BD_000662 [Candidatus Marinamargulisbacteria bacterium]|jgi:hypothetical protein
MNRNIALVLIIFSIFTKTHIAYMMENPSMSNTSTKTSFLANKKTNLDILSTKNVKTQRKPHFSKTKRNRISPNALESTENYSTQLILRKKQKLSPQKRWFSRFRKKINQPNVNAKVRFIQYRQERE